MKLSISALMLFLLPMLTLLLADLGLKFFSFIHHSLLSNNIITFSEKYKNLQKYTSIFLLCLLCTIVIILLHVIFLKKIVITFALNNKNLWKKFKNWKSVVYLSIYLAFASVFIPQYRAECPFGIIFLLSENFL